MIYLMDHLACKHLRNSSSSNYHKVLDVYLILSGETHKFSHSLLLAHHKDKIILHKLCISVRNQSLVASLNSNRLVRLIKVALLSEHIDGFVYQRSTLLQAEDNHLQFSTCKIHEL